MCDRTSQQVGAELRAILTKIEQERDAAFQRLAQLGLENVALRNQALELQLELARSQRVLAVNHATLTKIAMREAFRGRGV